MYCVLLYHYQISHERIVLLAFTQTAPLFTSGGVSPRVLHFHIDIPLAVGCGIYNPSLYGATVFFVKPLASFAVPLVAYQRINALLHSV